MQNEGQSESINNNNENNNNNQNFRKNIQNQNYNADNNMVINEGNDEIINEQKKQIERLNNIIKKKDAEIMNLIDEKNKMAEYIGELEQKINGFMELEKAKEE